MELSTGNPLMDCLVLLGLGAGGGYLLKKDTPERAEALKVKSANEATIAISGQKHQSYQKAAEALGKSFHSNPNVDPADAQAALVALAKNFGIVS